MRVNALAILGAAVDLAVQLTPDIQEDRYLVRAERQIEQHDYAGAKESMDQFLELPGADGRSGTGGGSRRSQTGSRVRRHPSTIPIHLQTFRLRTGLLTNTDGVSAADAFPWT